MGNINPSVAFQFQVSGIPSISASAALTVTLQFKDRVCAAQLFHGDTNSACEVLLIMLPAMAAPISDHVTNTFCTLK
jgi:hypothetical protein